jgi:hypothetical protein
VGFQHRSDSLQRRYGGSQAARQLRPLPSTGAR